MRDIKIDSNINSIAVLDIETKDIILKLRSKFLIGEDKVKVYKYKNTDLEGFTIDIAELALVCLIHEDLHLAIIDLIDLNTSIKLDNLTLEYADLEKYKGVFD